MVNRPFYIRKFHSRRLKEFGYKVENTFDESKTLGEIIGLTDGQMLRTLRDIGNKVVDRDKLEVLIKLRDMYRTKLTYSQKRANRERTTAIVKKIKSLPKRLRNNPVVQRAKKRYI